MQTSTVFLERNLAIPNKTKIYLKPVDLAIPLLGNTMTIPSNDAEARTHKLAHCSIGCNCKIIKNDLSIYTWVQPPVHKLVRPHSGVLRSSVNWCHDFQDISSWKSKVQACLQFTVLHVMQAIWENTRVSAYSCKRNSNNKRETNEVS